MPGDHFLTRSRRTTRMDRAISTMLNYDDGQMAVKE